MSRPRSAVISATISSILFSGRSVRRLPDLAQRLEDDRCDRRGFGEGLGQHDVAGLREDTEDAEQRRVSAGRDEDAILRWHQRPTREPRRGRILVRG
jgi:hypothetical protein